jgi:putative Holliday junction resolvase
MNRSDETGCRILGIDPGTKRYGFAVSDPLGITAQGLETFEPAGDGELMAKIGDLIAEYEAGVVLIGLPLSMSGGEIEGTERSRELAGRIGEKFAVEVVLRDERMTSLEAERALRTDGKIRNRGDIDRLSATLLLQSYLDERKRDAEG